MINYELQAHLKNLSLVGYENGQYQWVGTSEQWDKCYEEIQRYEMNSPFCNNEDCEEDHCRCNK